MAAPSAHVVGSAFVDQYYHILHASPELVYRFYQDTSVLTRPDANGAMTSVTTMQAINDVIMSLDYKNFRAEIKSADAQESYKGGVMVLVTGCLSGKDHTGRDYTQRKFAQSFFLAPQDKGYFVFNDVFRYFDEENPQTVSPESSGSVNLTTEPKLPESTHAFEHEHPVVPEPATPLVDEGIDNSEEVYNGTDSGEELVVDVEVVADSEVHSGQTEVRLKTEAVSSSAQEDAPKKSYASIVKVAKSDRRPIPVYVPAKNARLVSQNTEQQTAGLATLAPEVSPRGNNAVATSDALEEGHSIYIRNLPMNVTVTEVEEEFKNFGLIKPGGIQVRNNKQQGYCFGFVEFEASSSMQSAIEASRVTIGGREAIIEQKRAASRGASGRGRFPPTSRVVVRNENFSVRGNFGGGRSFGRTDFGNRGEYSGRGRGPSGRSGDGYQRVNQSGNVRGGRQGRDSQTSYS